MEILASEDVESFEQFCDEVVPGSLAVGPAKYVTDLGAGLARDGQVDLRQLVTKAITWLRQGRVQEESSEPDFLRLRALVIEIFYSGYCQPGYEGPDGWAVTGFDAAPMARLAKRDFEFLTLGVVR